MGTPNLRVRQARITDGSNLLEYILGQAEYMFPDQQVNRDYLKSQLLNYISYHIVVIAEDMSNESNPELAGVAIVVCHPSNLNLTSRIGTSLVWNVVPKFRGGPTSRLLLAEVERIGRNVLSELRISINDGMERAGKFLERLGYEQTQVIYKKEIEHG